MVTSDFRPKVEILPYRACAVQNMQYNRDYNSSVTTDLAMGADGTIHNVDLVYVNFVCRLFRAMAGRNI